MNNLIAVLMGKRRHELLKKKLGIKGYKAYQKKIITDSLKYEMRLCNLCKLNKVKRDTRWKKRKITCVDCKKEQRRNWYIKNKT